MRIYRRIYWARPGFDHLAKLAPAVAAALFGAVVNMGPAAAASFPQRALNALNWGASDYPDILPGPHIDDATLASLTAFLKRRKPNGKAVPIKAFEALQGERCLDLAERHPADEAFLHGWMANRLG